MPSDTPSPHNPVSPAELTSFYTAALPDAREALRLAIRDRRAADAAMLLDVVQQMERTLQLAQEALQQRAPAEVDSGLISTAPHSGAESLARALMPEGPGGLFGMGFAYTAPTACVYFASDGSGPARLEAFVEMEKERGLHRAAYGVDPATGTAWVLFHHPESILAVQEWYASQVQCQPSTTV